MMTEVELNVICTTATTEIMDELRAATEALNIHLREDIKDSDIMRTLQVTCDKSIVSVMRQYRSCAYTASLKDVKSTLGHKMLRKIHKQFMSYDASLNEYTYLGMFMTNLMGLVAACATIILIAPFLPSGTFVGDVYDPAYDPTKNYDPLPHTVKSFLLTGSIAIAAWFVFIPIMNNKFSLEFNKNVRFLCELTLFKVQTKHLPGHGDIARVEDDPAPHR